MAKFTSVCDQNENPDDAPVGEGNTVTAKIDLTALRHNAELVRKTCPENPIMAVVKADAYGHGLIPVARALPMVDGFAVARLGEALALRRAGIAQRILLLGTLLNKAEVAICAANELDVVVHDTSMLDLIIADVVPPSRIWLKLDTGMHRLGFSVGAFLDADRRLRAHIGIKEIIHMTHFAASDAEDPKRTKRQLDQFIACHGLCPHAGVSVANSAALLVHPKTRFGWVRPGIMLYGGRVHSSVQPPVRPAMSLMSKVLAIRRLTSADAVGYHGRWSSSRPSIIATIGAGYGDGYPRHALNGTPLLINGHRAGLVGRVSMDSLCADVTDCPNVAVGDDVELWGPALPAYEVARWARTIDYELFAGLPARAERVYVS